MNGDDDIWDWILELAAQSQSIVRIAVNWLHIELLIQLTVAAQVGINFLNLLVTISHI